MLTLSTVAPRTEARTNPRDQALSELSQAKGTLGPRSPATVQIRESILAREESSSPWSLGVFLQFFEPGGVGSIRGSNDYELIHLKSAPMLRLEGRWNLSSWSTRSLSWHPQLTAQA
ncbi:MAG: hypothetical protein KDD43_16790, partial [Bdellovibrionales bacterium]|nr:hypothetical protein [Bdellovibrionales bacterium]